MFALSMVLFGLLYSDAASADETPRDNAKPLSTEDCDKLIEQLVNPNKVPFKDVYVLNLKDAGVNEEELRESFKKVEEAYNALSKNIATALPVLMKRIDDKRYSFVAEDPSSGVYTIRTVGHACRAIVRHHVEVHWKETKRSVTEGRPREHAPSFISDLGKWWETRKGRSLAELQLEAMEWVMTLKKPDFFQSEEAWKDALTKVGDMADGIRRTKKPVFVNHKFYSIGK